MVLGEKARSLNRTYTYEKEQDEYDSKKLQLEKEDN
jgi:hypothetical protein